MDIAAYKNFTPRFDIRAALNGQLRASGAFFDGGGRQRRTFTADMRASWQGNAGELAESFLFDNGEKQNRIWKIQMLDNMHFTATAGDVAGTARGQQCGNAMNMRYNLVVPMGKMKIKLAMDDWMYLMADGTIINRTVMRKFGIKVGELSIVIQKC
jgi:hypothetical protein